MLHPPTIVEFVGGAPRQSATCPRLAAARNILATKAALRATLPAGLVYDPAVEILMSLFVAQATTERMTLDATARTTSGTVSVVTRWIRALEQQGLVTLSDDASGTWVALSPKGIASATRAIDAVLQRQAALLS